MTKKKVKEKYDREKKIIFSLFEKAYRKVRKTQKGEIYPTPQIMKMFGWGINLAKFTPLEMLEYMQKERIFRSVILRRAKRMLREKYPDLIIINGVAVGMGIRGYKVCSTLLDHRQEINKRLTTAVNQLQEADYVRSVGGRKYPQLIREYPRPLSPVIKRFLPAPHEKSVRSSSK